MFELGIDPPFVEHQHTVVGSGTGDGAGVHQDGQGTVFQIGQVGVAEEDYLGPGLRPGGAQRLQGGIMLHVVSVAVGGKDSV